MNHEPIQFLPLTPFWKTPPRRRAEKFFIFGIILGALGAVAVALILAALCRLPSVN